MFDEKVKQEQFPPGLGKFIQVHKQNSSYLLEFSEENLLIDAINDTCFCLRISQNKTWEETRHSSPQPLITSSFAKDAHSISFHFPHYHIKIDTANFSIDAYTSTGKTLLSKQKIFLLNSSFHIEREIEKDSFIYGLGQKTGSMNRAGKSYINWNTDILSDDPLKKVNNPEDKHAFDLDFDPYYMTMPFWHELDSTTGKAKAHFIDNISRSEFNFSIPEKLSISFSHGAYCEYIFCDDSIDALSAQFSQLTGKLERPPLWALGYHQCRWKKYHEDEFVALGEKSQELDIPCDSLWLDIDYMDEYRIFTWNEELFSKRQESFTKLKKMGIKVITIVDPGVKYEEDYEVFRDGLKKDVFCKNPLGKPYTGRVWPGKTAFPDFFKNSCQVWWQKRINKFIADGVDGIWIDMNEPATGDINCLDMLFEQNGKSICHELGHNDYGTAMAKATQEALKKSRPNERPFILSRAGSPGIQKHAANWLGDNASRWEHLGMNLSMGLGLSISGQAFNGADIGGFCEESNDELFLRWIQYAVWTPFFRNHNEHDRDQYPWAHHESILAPIRAAIKQRYEILPYLYSQFIKLACEEGKALQRPLLLDFQDDPKTWDIEDQFLCGRDILIAPILLAGQKEREVYLPEGDWYSWEGEAFSGGQSICISSKPETIPVFVRAGAIIPCLQEIPKNCQDANFQKIKLRVYPLRTTGTYQSLLICDDGHSYDYLKGQESRIHFTMTCHGTDLQIKARHNGQEQNIDFSIDNPSNIHISKVEL